MKGDKEVRKVKLIALLAGVAVFLLLGTPYLNQDFLSSALSQPVGELKSLENVSYSARVFPQNGSIVVDVHNPAPFALTVLNISGPGLGSTEPVTIPPKSDGVVIVRIYDFRDAMSSYLLGKFSLTVTLRFLNTTLTVVSK
ncbi:MAG: hypothetical protein ACP5HQ_01220 [Thermoprotei archaeon]